MCGGGGSIDRQLPWKPQPVQSSLLFYTHTTLYYPTQLVCIQSHKYTHLGRNVSRAALCWMNEFTQCAAAAEAEEARELYASAG